MTGADATAASGTSPRRPPLPSEARGGSLTDWLPLGTLARWAGGGFVACR